MATSMLLGCERVSKELVEMKGESNVTYELLQENQIPSRVKGTVSKRVRGFTCYIDERNNATYVHIGSGTKSSGGHSIEVRSIEKHDGNTTIFIEEKEPDGNQMSIQALTYPSVWIKIKESVGELSVQTVLENKQGNNLKELS